MRADRLLSILLLLQAHGRMSARTLAARLEVSERTVDRDLEALSIAGVPVFGTRGRRGGWQLADRYRTDLTGLSDAELRGLVVATAPAVLADLGLGDAADRAVLKVLSGLSATSRATAERARSYIHVDPAGWRRQDEAAPLVPRLEEALRLARRIRFRYQRLGEDSPVLRLADPLGLVVKGSVWYLVATVEGQQRTYRASRMVEVEVLDEHVLRPEGFDLPSFWAGSREAFVAELPRFDAVIEVRPDALARIRGGWRYAAIQEQQPAVDGWVRLRMRWDTIEVAVDHVLGLGPRARVVEPVELRDRVLADAAALLDIASGTQPAG